MRSLLGRRQQPSTPVASTPLVALQHELAEALEAGDLGRACTLDRAIEARKRDIDESRRKEVSHG